MLQLATRFSVAEFVTALCNFKATQDRARRVATCFHRSTKELVQLCVEPPSAQPRENSPTNEVFRGQILSYIYNSYNWSHWYCVGYLVKMLPTFYRWSTGSFFRRFCSRTDAMRWHRQMPALTLRDLIAIRKWLGVGDKSENRENLKGDIFDNERSTYRSNGKAFFAIETSLSIIISRGWSKTIFRNRSYLFHNMDSQQLFARPFEVLHGDSCPYWEFLPRKCLDLGSDGVFLDFREAALLLGSHVCCVGQAWWRREVCKTKRCSERFSDHSQCLFRSEIAIKDVFIPSY